MKTVALVTGGTGFIGYHLCKWLYENDYHVIATGINGENKPLCHDLHLLPLNQLPFDKMPNVDICFHQAANNDTTESNYEKMYETNFRKKIIVRILSMLLAVQSMETDQFLSMKLKLSQSH
jgi:nucleoside-diphosphate-sugar epimerase